jgi:HK97 family phage major capsid protein
MNREQILARLAQLAELRRVAVDRVNGLYTASVNENRSLTEAETTAVAEARRAVESIDQEVRDRRADLERLDAAEEAAAGDAPTVIDSGEERAAEAAAARKRGGAVVRREKRTYERWDLRTSYLRDLAAVSLPAAAGSTDPAEARQRLARHADEVRVDLPAIEARLAAARGGYANELRDDNGQDVEIRYGRGPEGSPEYRDLTRTDGAGGEFVPPLWLMEEWISVARGARTTADLCRGYPLPPGTDSINIPRIASGAATAIQTADNAAVQETDMTTNAVTASVRTIAGQQDVALQLLDQSPLAFDQITFMDLGEDHAFRLNGQVISGTNAAGQVRGILSIAGLDITAYTDLSPTVPELYPKLADSANQIATTRFRPVTAIIMAPRRWYWLLAAVDSATRPLVVMTAQGPNNALAAAFPANPAAEGGPVGVTPFGPVFIDPGIPTNLGAGTNEDTIILGRPEEYYLWEGAIRTRVLPEVGSGTLTVRFQLYSYVAFMPDRRPVSTSVVQGTGLVPPTF